MHRIIFLSFLGHTEQETKTLPTNQIPSQENNHVVNRMSRKQEDFSHNEKEQLDNKGNVQKPKDRSQMDGSLGQILEAINPVMFEKLFNESVQSENNVETPHSVLPDENGNNQEEINNEKIGTSMQFSEAMLKPFMGQASNKTKHDFFHKYMADAGDESESKGHQKTTEMSEWMKVDFHQGNELEK